MPIVDLARIAQLWNHAKVGPAKTRAHFVLPAEHLDEKARKSLGITFERDKHYLQVIVHEMYLTNARQWFVDYDPMVFVAGSYIYGTDVRTVPFVVGPAMLEKFKTQLPHGMIFRDTPASGLHPYRGGPMALTVILNKVQQANNATKLLSVVETISAAIDPSSSFTSYVKLAGPILDGVESLLGLNETEPVCGYSITVNPDIGQAFDSQYIALIDVDETKVSRDDFFVSEGRLCRGSKLSNAQPYTEQDFVLFRVAQGVKRTDERILPFYPLWQTTQDLAARPAKHYWDEAKANFNALKRELLASPDLTEPDVDRLTESYLASITSIRQRAVMESEMGPAHELSDSEQKLRAIADHLDALDNL